MRGHLGIAALFVLLVACPGPPPAEADAVAVRVSPDHVRVTLANSLQFTATVSGTMNRTVDWTVSGDQCSGAACGTIDSNGLYTAPDTLPENELVTVSARSRVDQNAGGEAAVYIGSLVDVVVNPAARLVLSGGSQRFTAAVTGSPNTSVSWMIDGDDCDPDRCGTINQDGWYRAPGPSRYSDRRVGARNSARRPKPSGSGRRQADVVDHRSPAAVIFCSA